MKKIKIGIDLDSTLNDLLPYWVDKYNKDYNDNLTLDKIIQWEMHRLVKDECGDKIYDYLKEPGFFRNLGIIKDSQEVVEWLSKFTNVELYIVTQYVPEGCLDKANWIREHFPFINEKNIIFINNKSMLDLDYLIDDSPYNMIEFDGEYILLDYPHNRNVFEPSYIKRVYNWLNIKEFFEENFNIKVDINSKYICDNCGRSMHYNPYTQSVKCECGSYHYNMKVNIEMGN